MEQFDFSLLNIGEIGDEINPLAFDASEYTDLTELIDHLRQRNPKKILDVRSMLPQLSLRGKVLDEPMEKYLATKAISSGQCKEALKSPLHWYIAANEPQARPEKKAFNLGTFLHTAFLEPDEFEKLVLEPVASLSTKDGVQAMVGFYEKEAKKVYTSTKGKARPLAKARHALKKSGLSSEKIDGLRLYLSALKDAVGKVAVDQHTYQLVQLIKRNYNTYGGGIIPELMRGACVETSFHGKDPETGLPVKIRPDGFNLEENVGCNMIISLKSTSADSIGKMQYDAAKYLYHLAEGMYCEVFEQVTGRKCGMVICVMIQTVYPYLPVVFFYNPEDLANGKYRYRLALRNVKEAIDKQHFPGFDSYAEEQEYGIIRMNLPEWSKREALPITIDN